MVRVPILPLFNSEEQKCHEENKVNSCIANKRFATNTLKQVEVFLIRCDTVSESVQQNTQEKVKGISFIIKAAIRTDMQVTASSGFSMVVWF